MSSKQSGFSIVEGVIAIVVIAVLGFIGWTVYSNYNTNHTTKVSDQTSSSQPTQPSTSSSTNTPISTDTYLTIKELGIKLKLSDNIKDLTYTYNNLYGINYIHFTTNSIMAADPTCNSDFDPLGLYTVYSDQTNANATNNMAGTLEVHVNGYYIYYRHAQVTCSKSTAGSIATSSIPSVLKAVQSAQAQ
jgi:Tfp pilus assembly protein PilV